MRSDSIPQLPFGELEVFDNVQMNFFMVLII